MLTDIKNEIGLADAVCVSEHWLKPDEHKIITPDAYSLAAFSARMNDAHGGTLILVRNNLSFSEIKFDDLKSIDTHFEFCVSKLEKCIVVALYRTPTGDYEIFFENLIHLLEKIQKFKTTAIVCADFNINVLMDSQKRNQLLNIFNMYGYGHTIQTPTRVTQRSEKAIDNIFINLLSTDTYEVVNKNYGISDHNCQIIKFSRDYTTVQNNNITQEKKRCFGTKAKQKFSNILQGINWQCMTSETDVNLKVEKFYNIVNTAMDVAFPYKTITKCVNGVHNEWITVGIRNSCKNKRALLEYVRFSEDPGFLNYVKKYCSILKRTIILAKRTFLLNKINLSEDKIATTWDIIKSEYKFEKTKSKKNITIQKNEEIIKDPTLIANSFNKYYINIIEELLENIPQSTCPLEKLRKVGPPLSDSFYLFPATNDEVKNIINKLPNKKSCGYDGIQTNLIKDNIEHLVEPLTDIINTSFAQGCFPEKPKHAIIVPIHKKGSTEEVANYRPISLLTILSKILEKAAKIRLVKFIENKTILNKFQFGFRENKNTTKALYEFIDNIYSGLTQKMNCLGVFCDLSKAFDCVCHSILLHKLEHYGIRGLPLEWFKSYLENRTQVVEINHYDDNKNLTKIQSDIEVVKQGVPQGSILGPILFLLYINDLPYNIPNAEFVQFADDTSLLIKKYDLLQQSITSNQVMRDVNEWLLSNKLLLNPDKTVKMHFKTSKQMHNTTPLHIGTTPIKTVEQTKFLGVWIDDLLTWDDHLIDLQKKLSSSIFAIRKIKERVGVQGAMIVYYSYFHSILSYGLEFWGSSNNTLTILKIQKHAVRAIFGLNMRESCRQFFINSKIFTIYNLYIFKLCLIIYDKKTELTTSSDIHTYNIRTKNLLRLPKVHLTKIQNGPNYTGIKLFNQLPDSIKNIDTKKHFKKQLKKWLSKFCFYNLQEYYDSTANVPHARSVAMCSDTHTPHTDP